MSSVMGTVAGHHLTRPQYLRVTQRWRELLAAESFELNGLAYLFDWMSAFEDALPDGKEKVTDAAVATAMSKAEEVEREPIEPRKRASYLARVLFAYQLGNLCYPSRVALRHHVNKPFLAGTRAWGNKLAWLLGFGQVDLLFVQQPVKPGQTHRVEPFLAGEYGDRVRDFLLLALQRRHLFSRARHLQGVLLDLSFSTMVISRYARSRASAEERGVVSAEDVAEALGIAELLFVSHAAIGQEGRVMSDLRWTMLTQRARRRALFGCEA